MMTCFSVPGGFLVSPLQGNVLQLAEKATNFLKKSKTSTVFKNISKPCERLNDLTLPAKDAKGHAPKKTKPDEKKGGYVGVRNSNCLDDISTTLNRDIDAKLSVEGEEISSELADESAKGASGMLGRSKEMESASGKSRISTSELPKNKLEFMSVMDGKGADNPEDGDAYLKGKLNSKISKVVKASEGITDSHKDSRIDIQRENKVVQKYGDTAKVDSEMYYGRKDQTYRTISCEQDGEKVMQGKEEFFDIQGKQEGSQMNGKSSVEFLKDNQGVQSSKAVKEKKKSSHAGTDQSEKQPKVKYRKEMSGDFLKESHGGVMSGALENESNLRDSQQKSKPKSMEAENVKEVMHGETSRDWLSSRKIDNNSISKEFDNRLIQNASTAIEAIAPAPAPVVIEEHWVCCDICQKWRLLPYGTNPDHLPKKWQCSLLNWLPGMNSCNISEEETTKALNALYMVPAPESAVVLDARHDLPASSVTMAGAQPSNQRSEHNMLSMGTSVRKKYGPKDGIPNQSSLMQVSNSLKKNPQVSMKNSKTAVGLESKSLDFTQEKEKPRPKKHKNLEIHPDGGDLIEKSRKHSKLKSKRVVDQDDIRASKKVKKEDLHKSADDWHPDLNLDKETVPIASTVPSTKQMARSSQKYGDVVSKGHLSTSSKRLKYGDQILSNRENVDFFSSSDIERSGNKPEPSAKKRKVKEWQESQRNVDDHVGSQQLLDSHIVANEASFVRKVSKEKSSKVARSEVKGTMEAMDSSLKREMAYAQASAGAATSSSSKVSGSFKSKVNVQEQRGSPVESVSSSPFRVSNAEKIFDKNSIMKDEAMNVVSCKVGNPKRWSDGELHLKRASHDDLLPSETEKIKVVGGLDINSSYVHETPDKRHAQDFDKTNNNRRTDGMSHQKSGKSSFSRSKDKLRNYKSDVDKGNFEVSGTLKEKVDDVREKDQHDLLQKREHMGNYYGVGRRDNHLNSGTQESLEEYRPSMRSKQHKDFDSRAAFTEAKGGNSDVHEDLKIKPSFRDEKLSIDLLSDQNGQAELPSVTDKLQPRANKQEEQTRFSQMACSPVKASRAELYSTDVVNSDSSKGAKQSRKPDIPNGKPGTLNGVQHNSLRQALLNGQDSSSPLRKDGHSAAAIVLKEARDLKHRANRLKIEGKEREGRGLYFEAALKFLHVASLWEPLSFDSSKQGDTAQSMQMYSETAKLCEFCAHEYERCKEMAAAALAYKCVEVAYMKAAYYKYPGASKDRHELQAALQMVTLGESPSSSASDVDNLNNQCTASKAASAAKGVNSPQVAGNHVATRNHHNLIRLLAYTNDLNCAFEATRKSQAAIAAAIASNEKDGADSIISIREVIDFNFHNVKGLLQRVRLSLESITR
nr:unnamed protein product [Ananas comosus var. bracteatus]